MKKLLPILLFLLTCNFIIGQERTISGKVTTTEDPGGLTGVTVMELGTSNVTITDANGFYTITVNEDVDFSQLNVFSVSGQQVLSKTIDENEFILDISPLKTGIYFERFRGVSGTHTIKIIKQ